MLDTEKVNTNILGFDGHPVISGLSPEAMVALDIAGAVLFAGIIWSIWNSKKTNKKGS